MDPLTCRMSPILDMVNARRSLVSVATEYKICLSRWADVGLSRPLVKLSFQGCFRKAKEGQEVGAHLIVPSASFPVFRKHLSGNDVVHVQLSRFPHEVVNAAVEYAYGGIENISPEIVNSLASVQDVLQNPSQNPYDDLKAAILQHTQPSAAERVEKLLQQECTGNLKPIALLNRMKLLAPGESFNTDFWKILCFRKLPSNIQLILANALKTEPIESLTDMADNILETVGFPRIEEIPHTPHFTPTKSEPPGAWEERMLKLEAKIEALTLQKSQLRSRSFKRRRSHSRHPSRSRRHENNSSFGKRATPAVVAETVSGHSSNRLFLQDRNWTRQHVTYLNYLVGSRGVMTCCNFYPESTDEGQLINQKTSDSDTSSSWRLHPNPSTVSRENYHRHYRGILSRISHFPASRTVAAGIHVMQLVSDRS
ncbi:unnamed protein product [Hymenolepis diminuta]|uniref:BTB domain-containing protein n=1 Tax=Hymenolepis diminuta TaxID=6216 RepID=A0A564YN45_HYMDI|nr:unnamed protein product [Hymenolepis diminuta]